MLNQHLPLPPTKLQQKILKNTDRHCPFRELSMSRCKIMEQNGPFSPHNIYSREGIFSGLVFRGILFNTDALQEHAGCGFFESWDAWKQFVAAHQDKKENYMCNPHVYGRTNGRSPSNAQHFWIGSEILHKKLLQEPNITFTEIVDFIATAKGLDKKTLFPTFGILTAYLFTVDLVYAGRAPIPSLEEVAKMVCKLDKGGSRGLMKIGVASDSSPKQIAGGFMELFHFLDQDKEFSHIKHKVIFDPFMLEHSLCKASRDSWLNFA
ncbi:hypothetical protein F5876DRAFT_38110 [Lentinula aff. lateritia]|uniref:Uncharacterized protein n=1 Tax=Lentinula aff. lateritia TaxID=2804960 RepID=A0ACC1U609_9AGAR|nr:hypothetical protein F5876DRAFT_38110 [Lentinula aff. lateritia]